jgi:AcrR family transcriptional regulator
MAGSTSSCRPTGDPALHPSAPLSRGPAAASDLLKQRGRDAVSTRTVSAAAGVQAPVIYRLFGDKEGLLDAIAVHGYATHLAHKKALARTEDPVDDLRAGWEQNISFALANPSLYALIWGEPRLDRIACSCRRSSGRSS